MNLLTVVPYEVAAHLVPNWDIDVLLVAFLAVLAVLALVMALRLRPILQAIGKADATSIGLAKDGDVALYGTAQPVRDAPLHAPLTGEPCIWYRYRIESRPDGSRPEKDTGQDWTLVTHAWSRAPILLSDATGTVRVEPAEREVVPSGRRRWGGTTRFPHDRPMPLEHSAQMAAMDTRMAELAKGVMLHTRTGEYRYTEEWISPGARVFVCGRLRSDPAPGPGPFPVAEHGELAVEAARRAPRAVSAPAGRPILIAAGSPESVVKRFRLKFAAAFTGGVLLGVGALYFELTREVNWETATRTIQDGQRQDAAPR